MSASATANLREALEGAANSASNNARSSRFYDEYFTVQP